jgi:hypothetical protein
MEYFGFFNFAVDAQDLFKDFSTAQTLFFELGTRALVNAVTPLPVTVSDEFARNTKTFYA